MKENSVTLQLCGVTEHMVSLFSLRKIFCSLHITLLSLREGVCNILIFVAGIVPWTSCNNVTSFHYCIYTILSYFTLVNHCSICANILSYVCHKMMDIEEVHKHPTGMSPINIFNIILCVIYEYIAVVLNSLYMQTNSMIVSTILLYNRSLIKSLY